MARTEKIIAAVDVGTTKIVAVAGRKNEEGKIEILGFGKSRSMGVKRGVVLNVEEAYNAINAAVKQAEEAFGGYIEEVYVNIVGQQLQTISTKGVKYIQGDRIVSETDVQELFEQALKVDLPEGYKIFHVSPQLYTIDQEAGIMNPVGTAGERIEAEFRLLVAPDVYEANLQKCFERGSIRIKKAIVDPLASSEIILSEDEKEAGVVLVDIGGGTTKIAVYYDGVLCYSSLIPFGGNVITHDIKEGCAILARQAESLKVQFGQAIGDFAPDDRVVTIPGISGWEPKEISFKSLAFIMQARMEEIIDGFFYQLQQAGCIDKVGAGIVLTGGTALMPNLAQLIQFRTGLNVRIGTPKLNFAPEWKKLEDPRNATVMGLFMHAINEQDGTSGKQRKQKAKKERSNQPGFFTTVKKQVAEQITLFFNEEQDMEMS